ncbi:hypothetical protein EVG20_g843 [Dentipellis fragilis]|uniref:Uncharacterized protein n=1 Tax=Dentipellis fragilis TaxID=205917 RepID=A0A4Y9ZEG0_9AGAM|nr:hypothetical protein EVG20_g843 [Dentipellis fragilis]
MGRRCSVSKTAKQKDSASRNGVVFNPCILKPSPSQMLVSRVCECKKKPFPKFPGYHLSEHVKIVSGYRDDNNSIDGDNRIVGVSEFIERYKKKKKSTSSSNDSSDSSSSGTSDSGSSGTSDYSSGSSEYSYSEYEWENDLQSAREHEDDCWWSIQSIKSRGIMIIANMSA